MAKDGDVDYSALSRAIEAGQYTVGTPTRRPTDEDYADMAASYAADPPRADEVLGPVEVDPHGPPPT